MVLVSVFGYAAEESATPEPGERLLGAKDAAVALSAITKAFKAHPTVRAHIQSEIDDLAGKRVEEGALLLDRGEGHPPRVLRTFTKPAQKAWLMSGTSISEFVPSKKTVYSKDLSAAPKALKHIQAAMIGDIPALGEIFTIHVFSKPAVAATNNKDVLLRLVLDKKPGVSKYIHRRIEARINEGGMFFDEIHYTPDEGDELTEKFLEIKDAGNVTDANFALASASDLDGIERKTETISE